MHVLGIRHHGPGSAQRVKAFLEATRPDLVLVEGPPEADDLLAWATHPELQPPVALLCYVPDAPAQSVFYPFAAFSPEWQAIRYARQAGIPIRFCDLPAGQQLAFRKPEAPGDATTTDDDDAALPPPETPSAEPAFDIRKDPIGYLAEAAGYDDGERWWEHTFEQRRSHEEVPDAIAEAMQQLRAGLRLPEDRLEAAREAHMRRAIRAAGKELFQNIVVICGAWHVPALLEWPAQKADNDLLKGLPKVKIECTWVPWSHNRLSYYSGYGAGIHSPGWYSHLWHYPDDDGTRWMSRVAELLRRSGLDTSTAHVIEGVRLAAALASLRGLPRPSLEEMNEAALSVLCHGDELKLRLIAQQLIVGNELGAVPADIPKPPLQADIERQQRSLRLPATADFKDYTLDLRKELDLQRSVFLHRLRLLGIGWGEESAAAGKGTFKEQWRLQWEPEYSVAIIERGIWGNTVEAAATRFVMQAAADATSLPAVTELLQQTLPAELGEAIDALLQQIDNRAAASADVLQLAEAVPPLAAVSRYGNVRQTDVGLVQGIVETMVARICVGLPNAVSGLSADAAAPLPELLRKLHEAITLLQQPGSLEQWQLTLQRMAHSEAVSPVVAGYAARLLKDAAVLVGEELVRVFGLRMSRVQPPATSAAWLEGFLKGSGTLLLLDEDLWSVLQGWIDGLNEEVFLELLPLLRRTFAQFTTPERRKLGEKAKSGDSAGAVRSSTGAGFNAERAARGIPVVLQLLGVAGQPADEIHLEPS